MLAVALCVSTRFVLLLLPPIPVWVCISSYVHAATAKRCMLKCAFAKCLASLFINCSQGVWVSGRCLRFLLLPEPVMLLAPVRLQSTSSSTGRNCSHRSPKPSATRTRSGMSFCVRPALHSARCQRRSNGRIGQHPTWLTQRGIGHKPMRLPVHPIWLALALQHLSWLTLALRPVWLMLALLPQQGQHPSGTPTPQQAQSPSCVHHCPSDCGARTHMSSLGVRELRRCSALMRLPLS